jgi:hypothetical protein
MNRDAADRRGDRADVANKHGADPRTGSGMDGVPLDEVDDRPVGAHDCLGTQRDELHDPLQVVALSGDQPLSLDDARQTRVREDSRPSGAAGERRLDFCWGSGGAHSLH